MKVISFAVWGNNKLYNQGVIENVKEAKKHYPDWTCRIHCADDSQVLEELKTLDCQTVPFTPIIVNGEYAWNNIFWRYSSAADPNVEVSIFRDADSRVNSREAGAVKQWLESDKALHVMHDDPTHYRLALCSGMWGIRGGWLPHIKKMGECWQRSRSMVDVCDKKLAVDEVFLHEVVWPMFKYGNYMGHGIQANPWGDNEYPFPAHEPIEFGRYIGQVIQLQVEPPKLPKFFHFRHK